MEIHTGFFDDGRDGPEVLGAGDRSNGVCVIWRFMTCRFENFMSSSNFTWVYFLSNYEGLLK